MMTKKATTTTQANARAQTVMTTHEVRRRVISLSGVACQECGRKFRTTSAAAAAARNGCPGCGGCDIDLE
jgi:PHP family Zn ribbon phosphoesterase